MFPRYHSKGCRNVQAILFELAICAASIAQGKFSFNSNQQNFVMFLLLAPEGLKYNEYGFERGGV